MPKDSQSHDDIIDRININLFRVLLYVISKIRIIFLVTLFPFLLSIYLSYNSDNFFEDNFYFFSISPYEASKYLNFNSEQILFKERYYASNTEINIIDEEVLMRNFFDEFVNEKYLLNNIIKTLKPNSKSEEINYQKYYEENIDYQIIIDADRFKNRIKIKIYAPLKYRIDINNALEKSVNEANLKLKSLFQSYYKNEFTKIIQDTINLEIETLKILKKNLEEEEDKYKKIRILFLSQQAEIAKSLDYKDAQFTNTRETTLPPYDFSSDYYTRGYVAIEKEIESITSGTFVNPSTTKQKLEIDTKMKKVETDLLPIITTMNQTPIFNANEEFSAIKIPFMTKDETFETFSNKIKIVLLGLFIPLIIIIAIFTILGIKKEINQSLD